MPFSNDQQPKTHPFSTRNIGLDALRTLAIVGMMAAHTSRLIVFEVRPDWARGVLLLEPVIPSLFLLMVGISLTLSLEKSRMKPGGLKGWYTRQAKRAAVLWVISTVFYVLELGARFPDFVTASGVLATIAYAILGVGALLLLPRAEWAVGGALMLGTAAFLKIDMDGLRVFPLNVGNAPFFPLWLFTLAGALWGLLHRRVPRLIFWGGLLALLPAAVLLYRYGLDPLFTKPFGRNDASRLLTAPLTGGEERHVGYYNLRPVLALFCLCVHLGALSLLGKLSLLRERTARGLSRLFILGRHSLGVYILHLTLLAILVVTLGIRPLRAAWQGSAVLITVVVVSWGWCFLREKRK